jgi:adenine-specific DNA-methyltransferase
MPTLDWIGKQAVVNHHREVPYRLLHCDGALSAGASEAGNLLVQGDNLEALRALLPYYAKRVKCIYIDPPYNTGNEGWAYNDNVNSPEMRAWLGKVVGKEAEDLSRHDKWLCMMYPRLMLLRDFLTEDGSIVVSIDENEITSLTVLLDEIFGRSNRVGTIVWQKGNKGDAKLIAAIHEYLIIYANNKAVLTERDVKWRRRKAGADDVLAQYKTLRDEYGSNHEAVRVAMMKWYKSLAKDDPKKAHKHYNWSDDRGLYFAADFAGPDDGRESRPRYDIPHPKTGKPCKMPSTGWRWEEDTTLAALAMVPPRIHFGKTHATIPCRKSYLFEIDEEPLQSVFYKDGRAATLQVEGILGPGAFQFPKDVDVLSEILSVLTSEGDLVLDSFAGSGSTGHAVLSAMSSQYRGCARAADQIKTYFSEVMEALRKNDLDHARYLTSHLSEPRETFLGFSKGQPKGRGVGRFQADQLLSAFRRSQAFKSGMLSDLCSRDVVMLPSQIRGSLSSLPTIKFKGS